MYKAGLGSKKNNQSFERLMEHYYIHNLEIEKSMAQLQTYQYKAVHFNRQAKQGEH